MSSNKTVTCPDYTDEKEPPAFDGVGSVEFCMIDLLLKTLGSTVRDLWNAHMN
jgi:hypothetical protein